MATLKELEKIALELGHEFDVQAERHRSKLGQLKDKITELREAATDGTVTIEVGDDAPDDTEPASPKEPDA